MTKSLPGTPPNIKSKICVNVLRYEDLNVAWFSVSSIYRSCFNGWEVDVCYLDIGGIVDIHCLSFLFIIFIMTL
jgi:hypothetical protein